MSNPSLTFKIAVTKRIIDDPKCVYGTTDWLTRHNPLVLDVLNEMESTEITVYIYIYVCIYTRIDIRFLCVCVQLKPATYNLLGLFAGM